MNNDKALIKNNIEYENEIFDAIIAKLNIFE